MNRLLSAARHYVDCMTAGWGDADAARQELLDAAHEAAPMRYLNAPAAPDPTVVKFARSLFHADANRLVEASIAQADMEDRFGHARIPDPCDCRGGVCCKGVLANGLTEDHKRCKAHTQE